MLLMKRLRKPNPDITELGINPLEFRKFFRQFTAYIAMNSDCEDEKMNYLEQFTYEEEHNIVQVFDHLRSEHAYNAATKQLEDGDTECYHTYFQKEGI